MPPTYIDPKTKKTVDLSSYGALGPQNYEANKRGLDVAITSDSLAPQAPITLPEKPLPPTADIMTGQAIIDAQNAAQSTTATKEEAPKEPTAIEKYLTGLKTPSSTAEIYQKDYETSGIPMAEKDVLAKERLVKTAQGKLATINAELKAINIEAEQAQLSLKGQGRGQTTDFLNRQASEIRNQAALKALPLQVQALVAQADVQSAQGDVELAQNSVKLASDRLTTLFNLHVKDQENQYNYNKDLRDKVYEFMTTQEKTQLTKLQKDDDRNFELKKDSINNAQALSKIALESGQADIAARITQLDPNSKTYNDDVAVLQTEIQPKATYKQIPISKDLIRAADQQLDVSRGDNGYVDPTVYQQAFEDWVNGSDTHAPIGTAKEFLANFPPKNYVDPENTWLPEYLMPAGSRTKAKTTTNKARF